MILSCFSVAIGDEAPQSDLNDWLKSQGLGKTRDRTLCLFAHDVYVIGTQESSLHEKEWVNRIKLCLQESFSVDMYTVCMVSRSHWLLL